MNESDLAILRQCCIRLRQSLVRVKRLADIPPMDTAKDVLETIDVLERDIARFTEQVQQRETISWGRADGRRGHPPRHAAHQWIAPPDSRTLDPDAHVKTFDAEGRRILPSDPRR